MGKKKCTQRRLVVGWGGMPALPGMAQVQERSFGTASGTAQNRRFWEDWGTQRGGRSCYLAPPLGGEEALGVGPIHGLQGYLAHKKTLPPMTLQ